MLAIEGKNLRKRFTTRMPGSFLSGPPVDALRGVSLSVADGEIFGIVGESGSGKSTLARVLIGATAADGGTVELYGAPLGATRDVARIVQMVPQDSTSTLNPRLNLLDAVAFGPWARGEGAAQARRLAGEALERVGLPPAQFGRRRPSEISGGQRQRVNLARAIVLKPRILFLDEPVSALDKTVQAQILNLLVDLGRDLGLTMVMISHDLDVVRYLCARTAVMRDGEIVENAPTDQLFAAPQHDYTKVLVATLPSHYGAPRLPAPAAPTPLLRFDHIAVTFVHKGGSTRAVRGASLSLDPGETLAIVGESGSGKSVMLRALMGLLPASAEVSGSIEFSGTRVDATDTNRLARFRGRTAGMVFQNPLGSLDAMAPIGRQLEDVVIALRGVPRAAARDIALGLLERVHLSAARHRYGAMPHELSGGQRQRVGIAMALAGQPPLLLADEPTTALDVSVQARILDLLQQLTAEEKLGLVLVTHDIAVARQMADRVAVMYAGRIVELGPAATVLDRPAHPYSQILLRSFMGVRQRQMPLPSLPGAPPRLLSEPAGCAFAARCPVAQPQCHTVSPRRTPLAGGYAECLLVHAPGATEHA